MSSDLINKILEEIGLESIKKEGKDDQGEDLCVKKPTPESE